MSSTVKKSYNEYDCVKAYCLENSTARHPVQIKLQEETLKLARGAMLGAPEVLAVNALLIKTMGAKRVLDIGVFTGASCLAAALALPEDGYILACDVNEEWTNKAKEFWKEAGVQDKINLVIDPATKTLQSAIEDNQEGTFDFAFIDADKMNYDAYYELTLKLLRKGGTIAFDNTLSMGTVLDKSNTEEKTEFFRTFNAKIAQDERVFSVMMNIGDGLTLVTKL